MSSSTAPADTNLNFGDDACFYNVLRRENEPPRRRIIRSVQIVTFVLVSALIPLMVVLEALGINVITKSEGLGKVITYNNGYGEVFYRDGASASDARNLGGFLHDTGYFSPRPFDILHVRQARQAGATVQLRKPKGTFIVACVVKNGSWLSNDNVEAFRDLRKQLQEQVFNGQSVVVHLCEATVSVTAGKHLTLTVRKVIHD